jgi:DNA-binding MarR family transcriptional regulator
MSELVSDSDPASPELTIPEAELEADAQAEVEDDVFDYGECLGYWLRFVAGLVSDRLNLLLKEHDITEAEWVVLRTMYQESWMPYAAFQRALGNTMGGAWKIAARLEKRGLLERRLAKGSVRFQWLSLTARGESLVPQLAALAERNEEYFFVHLPPHTRAALIGQLRDLAARYQFANRRAYR